MSSFGQFFIGFKKGVHNFGQTIATIINSVLLLIVYVLGVGLTSIFSKIFKKIFLEMGISKKQDSYWSELNIRKKPMKEYYRQF